MEGSRKLAVGLALGLLLGLTGGVFAQGPAPEDLKTRVERLEKQNLELMQALQKLQGTARTPDPSQVPAATGGSEQQDVTLNESAVQRLVGDYLKNLDEKKKAEQEAAKQKEELEGYKVGTDLGMTVRWNNGLTFETAHKDFYTHIGGWFQYDNVWFNQSKNLRGAPPAGVGDFQDGDFFRRTRLQLDGGFWQVFEYNMIWGFESTQKSTVSLFEFWGGIKDVPLLGMVRVGRMVTPNGLEGDDTTTNKAMTFFERSSMSDAFYQNFASGIWQGNSILDQRFCYQSMLYYTDAGLTATSAPPVGGLNTGDFFGDGEFAAGVRLTGLPVWEDDGRCFVHLGASFNWHHATRGGAELGDPQFVRFRARTEQRDFAEDIDGTVHDGVLNPGDANRMIDTGLIQAEGSSVVGTEFAWIRGPFSLQAEYAWASANSAVVAGRPIGNAWFDGGYIQASYFLTGENRTYDRRVGRFAPTYMSGPNTPFWLVRDQNGGTSWGVGAWELAARWSHLDLNGGNGAINGGIMDGLTLGVNWYLNPNFKIQFEYVNDERFHTAPTVVPGFVEGFGVRAQVAF